MKLSEKRDIARQLRNEGKLNVTGTEIVRMTNEDLDPILRANGIDPDADAWVAPSAPLSGSVTAPVASYGEAVDTDTDKEKQALQALRDLLGAGQAKADPATAEELRELAERVASLESASAPREVIVTNPERGQSVNVGLVHYMFETLLASVSAGIHCFLSGPPGSFKTSTACKVADALGLKHSALSVCQQTTAVSLLGYLDATGTYRGTEFRKRYQDGGVFILDEIDNGNANVLSVLNSALANGSCAFPDGMVSRHPDFRLIATGNTVGKGGNAQFVGRCALDSATLDRLALIHWPYDEGMERQLAGNDAWFETVVTCRHAAENLGSKAIISPRATFDGAKLLAAGVPESTVLDMVVFRGLSNEEQSRIRAEASVVRARSATVAA